MLSTANAEHGFFRVEEPVHGRFRSGPARVAAHRAERLLAVQSEAICGAALQDQPSTPRIVGEGERIRAAIHDASATR